jgi:hypothetical protein
MAYFESILIICYTIVRLIKKGGKIMEVKFSKLSIIMAATIALTAQMADAKSSSSSTGSSPNDSSRATAIIREAPRLKNHQSTPKNAPEKASIQQISQQENLVKNQASQTHQSAGQPDAGTMATVKVSLKTGEVSLGETATAAKKVEK